MRIYEVTTVTDNFAKEFENYRGYDVLNYLPVVAGYIIDDINTSNSFLSDFRKTLGDLVAHNHYAHFQTKAHKYNMRINHESAGPHAGYFDGIKNYRFSISLVGGVKSEQQFIDLADKIWGKLVSEKGEKEYGKGSVVWGMTAREYLLSKQIPIDFDVLENDSRTDFDYIHYIIGESDVCFVTKQTTERQKINAMFRVSGKQPELWDALSGEIKEAKAFTQKEDRTTLPLTLEPYAAIFVVFNRKIGKEIQGSSQRNYSDYKTVKTIEGEWVVHFDPKWGGPASVTFTGLIDWTTLSDERIKYCSGTAGYNINFNICFEPQKDKRYF